MVLLHVINITIAKQGYIQITYYIDTFYKSLSKIHTPHQGRGRGVQTPPEIKDKTILK